MFMSGACAERWTRALTRRSSIRGAAKATCFRRRRAAMFKSVRARLTAWYVLVFGVLLLGFSIFMYAVFSHYAYSRLDQFLTNVAQTAAGAIRAETGENGGDAPSATAEALNELWLPDVYVAVFKDGQVLNSNYP